MNNEIGRKLTSLTLMTIMLAGGMTIAAPSMMVPEAQAAGALYVSAENAMFDNTFGGAQIVEVVVFSGQNETDEAQAEPVVKVDENLLRMAQYTLYTGQYICRVSTILLQTVSTLCKPKITHD